MAPFASQRADRRHHTTNCPFNRSTMLCSAPEQGQSGKNRWLYLSAHPQLARAHITALKPSRIVNEPPAFVMLLRKYLEGTRIEAIEQARWERVIEIRAGHRSASDPENHTSYRLVIELMGRMSNIILCNDQGLILGSLKHVGADINRYRTICSTGTSSPFGLVVLSQ